ncbi:hypothetical protein HOLleu_28707 [Holothuria leucospilota]|uniref:Uncharacterized protein n=1 Tax=Holothuria leucospilota TaxID=206669 RepID=A0A9Q1BMG2_HOLLE|nr:hypothetical protein HOLleu_28707 [Holothuria leucospilota]
MTQRGWSYGLSYEDPTQAKQPGQKFIECNQPSPTDTYDITPKWTPDQRQMTQRG